MTFDELKNLDVQDLVDSLQNLDFENVGSWPIAVKVAAAVLLFALVIAAGYFVTIKPANQELQRLQNEQSELMEEFEEKSFKAKNLDQYKKQLAEMEKSFGSLLQQLPKDTEVPGLLEDITHTGLGSGLEFQEISLAQEREKEFYAELPINISVRGDYHGFGAFVSGVAALPRIVTLHDFAIEPVQSGSGQTGGLLQMTVTAKTYRYASGPGSQSGGNGQQGD
jgi:type IV pilus assembly protein PilO